MWQCNGQWYSAIAGHYCPVYCSYDAEKNINVKHSHFLLSLEICICVVSNCFIWLELDLLFIYSFGFIYLDTCTSFYKNDGTVSFFPFNWCSSSSTNFVLLSIICIIYCIVLPYNQSVDFTEKELIYIWWIYNHDVR